MSCKKEPQNDNEDFIYLASHDLKEPLRKIISFSNVLAEDYKDKLDKTGKEYLEYIVDGGKRLQEMLDGLLSYSRIGRLNQAITEVDISKVIETIMMHRESFYQKQPPQLTLSNLPVVHSQYKLIYTLFEEMLDNATKFNEQKQVKITISCKKTDDGVYHFTFQDNSFGFDNKFALKIFNLFHILQPKFTYKGHGIGLALCKKIIHLHDGEISADSKPGVGTTFTFTLKDLKN